MADPTPVTVPPPTPGASTSEYLVTKVTLALTIAASVVGVLLDVLQNPAVAAFPWAGKALSALGLIATVLTSIGYQVTRAQVKVAAHDAAGQVAVANADANAAAANVAKS
jgi:hypothetical protein